MMKLGQLYLANGRWNGQQLLDPAWVREVSTPKFTFPKTDDPWSVGYGYQFWMSPYPNSYRADGAYGRVRTQRLTISPVSYTHLCNLLRKRAVA